MNLGLSMDGSLNQINHKLREKEKKRTEERRRSIPYLIAQYLKQHGLTDSYGTLFSEAQLPTDIQIADNIDLEMILMEYDSYYHLKFNKYPILYKTVQSTSSTNPIKKIKTVIKSNKNDTAKEDVTQQTNFSPENDICFGLTVSPLFIPKENVNENNNLTKDVPNNRPTKSKILSCIEKLYPPDSELRKIAEDISTEIVLGNLNVSWDDVIGLDKCKAAIKEAIVYPLKYPIFFSDKFAPWKGILLYGPPGTGKTMLAKAAATECNCTFINVTASLLVSKWRGDSEKYIRVLFDLAYNQSPAIIFIDEIDWISTNNTNDSLSEPAKRFRAELLTRLDGLLSPEGSNVMLLAATNAPWNIDAALLRRLEKQIYVTLPDEDSRLNLFSSYVSPNIMEEKGNYLVEVTNDYSAAEIKLICKEAWIIQSAPTWNRLENNEITVTNLQFNITSFSSLVHAIKNIQGTDKNIPKYNDWIKS
ncbi:katanin p60 ATPase-containing subunit A-like 2 isoform X1 [Osmia bicornis bicornis]|uniref:katanin p60 ATPase-containing subunit A-like 2 isoform X1 n=1 Tax=Osmia bicornis bicornis TaxID=1437191 RepID=UPI0010F93D84|nr:katanin p60 ATPase-containing subunit A-like 2 isoform X1 [Osmia bicornis bicornis]